MATAPPILAQINQLRIHEEQFLKMHYNLMNELVLGERKYAIDKPGQLLSAKGIRHFSNFMMQYVGREEKDKNISGYRHARASLLVVLRNSGSRDAAQWLFRRWSYIEKGLKVLDKLINNPRMDVQAWKKQMYEIAQGISIQQQAIVDYIRRLESVLAR